MKLGYCRVSTLDQSLDLQIDALIGAGVEKNNIYVDKLSGKSKDRPQFQEVLRALRAGDIFVFYKLDRIGRNLRDLIEIVDDLQKRNVNIICIKDCIDTSSSTGRVMFQLLGVFAEYERNLIVERTVAGLEAARARGRKGGRPPMDRKKIEKAVKLYRSGGLTVKEITEATGVNRGTLYRSLK